MRAKVVVLEAMKPVTVCESGGRCLSFASSLAAGTMLLTTVAGVSAAPGDVIGVLHHPNAMEHRPFFGASLAVYGDRLVVGAPLADLENVDTGIAFLMDVESGEVLREFRNPTPNPQERFGSSIAPIQRRFE